MALSEQLVLFFISLLANILSAMAGGGAGLLQLPALIFLGLPFSTALATHKIATVALGVGASFRHLQTGSIDWRFAMMLMASGIPGVVLGANIVLMISQASAKILLGILTIGLGLYSVLKPAIGDNLQLKNRHTQGLITGGLVLFSLGVLNGSLTSGTGLFVTMWLISWFGLDYQRATAYTMVLVGIFWNATGAVSLLTQTVAEVSVKWSWLPILILGSFAGGVYGAHLALKHGNPVIKRIFEVITVLAGLSLIFSSME